jgi:hypothetical protein
MKNKLVFFFVIFLIICEACRAECNLKAEERREEIFKRCASGPNADKFLSLLRCLRRERKVAQNELRLLEATGDGDIQCTVEYREWLIRLLRWEIEYFGDVLEGDYEWLEEIERAEKYDYYPWYGEWAKIEAYMERYKTRN